MSDLRGLVMAESSRLTPATDRYRSLGGGGSGGPPRDLYMDTQPLDYSTKKSHAGLLSLTSMDNGTNQHGDASARAIFSKAMAMSAMHADPQTSALDSGLLSRSACQPMSMSYSPAHQHPAAYRTPPPPAYQPFLAGSPPQQTSPLAPLSSFHSPAAVSSLLLAQLQANPLLFSTLLAKTNLAQQQLLLQQQQQQQEQQKSKGRLSPRMSPQPSDHHRPPSPAPLPAFPGLGGGGLDLLHPHAGYPEHLGAGSGVLYHGATKEEFKLLERSNEEFRNFRESFLTEASKLRIRRGGKKSYTASTAPATVTAAPPVSGDTSDSSRGAADDQASEGGMEMMSVCGGNDDEGSRTENDRSEDDRAPDDDRVDTSSETGGLVPYVPTRRSKGGERAVKDQAYWERRRKNNEAAKRSRDARRAKEEEIAIRGAFLEQENMKLRAELSTLKSETAKLRCLLYNS